MLQCPSCDTTLDQDFGLVTCKNCKAVLMIDSSGNVQIGSAEYNPPQEGYDTSSTMSFPSSVEEDIVEEFEPPFEEDDFFSEEQDLNAEVEEFKDPAIEENFVEPEESFDDGEIDDLTPEFEHALEESATDLESFPEQEEDSFEDSVLEEGAVVSNDTTEVAEAVEEDFTMAAEPDNKPVDITEFANSEESSLEGGELLYDVIIDGLDSSDLREDFKLVLMDSKLQLNHHTYMKSIKNGRVVIPDLNPIKAKRIVEQLQFFNLDIRWQQKRVIMESDHHQDDSVDEEADL